MVSVVDFDSSAAAVVGYEILFYYYLSSLSWSWIIGGGWDVSGKGGCWGAYEGGIPTVTAGMMTLVMAIVKYLC